MKRRERERRERERGDRWREEREEGGACCKYARIGFFVTSSLPFRDAKKSKRLMTNLVGDASVLSALSEAQQHPAAATTKKPHAGEKRRRCERRMKAAAKRSAIQS